MNQDNIKKLAQLVSGAKTILVLQPEKPDTDSLTSALALEHILGDFGKEVVLYCQDKIPSYIAHFQGADRVMDEFPAKFDLTILVDTGGPVMMDRTLQKHQSQLVKKPFVIIDHHPNREPMPFATIDVIDPTATSTCGVIYELAKTLGWPVSQAAATLLIPGILADTRNLSIYTVGAKDFRQVAELIDLGVDIFQIHEDYRKVNAISIELMKLKGKLLARTETFCDGKIAFVHITPAELKQYAEIHDPADLVMYEMQRAEGVQVAVGLREYGGETNKIKVSTRANIPVAAMTCQAFGGGGHDRAAGCQFNNRPADEAKAEFIKLLCDNIKQYEANQHADQKKAAV